MIKAVIFDYGAVLNRRLRSQKELYELAADLRKQGIKTAILSNIATVLTWPVKIRGDVKDFEPIGFSSEIGHKKPDPRAYQAILDKLGVKAQDCLFVDNRLDNIDGARKLGMQVVVSKTTAQTAEDIRRMLKVT